MALFHCTKSIHAIANILEHGFAYVALPTKVAWFILPEIPKADREPQQFGMISFRQESDGLIPERHLATYGRYAICIDANWAISAGAHPVLYVRPSDSIANAFTRLFRAARKSIDHEADLHPEDSTRHMMFNNRSMGGVLGAAEWSDLLTIFQFMAPAEDEWESEWRIVNPHPNYSIAKVPSQAIHKVTPPQGWATVMNVLRPPPEAILYLLAPSVDQVALRAQLPERFRSIEIKEFA